MVYSSPIILSFIISYFIFLPCTTGETENESDKLNVLNYNKGSICGYCIYCRFCALCDVDCPCTRGPSKPNCHMCKYCKYCPLCSTFCDTVCSPGGVVDTFTSAISGLISSHSEESVKDDILSVEDYIK